MSEERITTEERRCTGHCCRKFYLPHSPEELRQSYENWGKQDGSTWAIDIHLIYPMVIHLGPVEPNKPEAGHNYTCKHLETISGNCSIYAIRPSMCSDYPYGRECKFEGCTLERSEPALKILRETGESASSCGLPQSSSVDLG